jgi:hypothetical protein
MARKRTRTRHQGARSPATSRNGPYSITVEDTLAFHRAHHAPGYLPRKIATEKACEADAEDARPDVA